MKRAFTLPTLLLPTLLVAACSGMAPAKTEATAFQNEATGQVVAGCGPMQGFKGAIDEAQKGCNQAWQAKGWTPLNQSVAAVPQ